MSVIARDETTWPRYVPGATVVERLFARAERWPEGTAFVITDARGTTTLTWGELAARVRSAAARLAAAGVGGDDVVALVDTTTPELVVLVLAAQAVGAWPMILHAGLPPERVARRAAAVQARLVVDAAMARELAAPGADGAVTAARLDGIAFLQLTSGTSGDSRAAAVSHRALVAYLETHLPRGIIGPDDVLVSWMPLHHDLGLVRFLLTPVWFGLPCHLLPPALTSLGPWLRTLTAVRGTVTGAPDFAYRIAARALPPEGIDLGALRVGTIGAEPVRASTIAAFEARFACPGALRPGYGLAEATLGVSAVSPGAALRIDARGAVGCGRLDVVDGRVMRDGVAVGPNEPGELEIRGATLFEGYYDPRLPGRFDRSSFTADGFHRTGDTVYLDDDGELFVLGRTRAMVKQAGALIAPREVEELADAVPGVRLSAAIGLPNDRDGSEELVVVAEVPDTLGPDANAARAALVTAIGDAVRRGLASVPGRVVLVAPRTIPITANGKIRHAALRAAMLTPPSPAPTNEAATRPR